jgi:hypothetical protein
MAKPGAQQKLGGTTRAGFRHGGGDFPNDNVVRYSRGGRSPELLMRFLN